MYDNLYQMSMVPCTMNQTSEVQGQCTANVDGKCIYGGTKVAGLKGYDLASLGAPAKTCASFPLFYSGNVPYSFDGAATASNANPFRVQWPNLI